MNERRRYPTDEEAIYDCTYEGFGVESEVEAARKAMLSVEGSSADNKAGSFTAKSDALLSVMMLSFGPIIDQAERELREAAPRLSRDIRINQEIDMDHIRWGTDGGTIFEDHSQKDK